jgi:hypothetical protein
VVLNQGVDHEDRENLLFHRVGAVHYSGVAGL